MVKILRVFDDWKMSYLGRKGHLSLIRIGKDDLISRLENAYDEVDRLTGALRIERGYESFLFAYLIKIFNSNNFLCAENIQQVEKNL